MKKLIILLIPFAAFGQVKISDMPVATTLSGTELIPIVQGGVNKKATPSLWQSYLSFGDMNLSSVQTNTGLKTFLDGTLGLSNVANTFTSTFTNTNTAARTYTLPDFSGNFLVGGGSNTLSASTSIVGNSSMTFSNYSTGSKSSIIFNPIASVSGLGQSRIFQILPTITQSNANSSSTLSIGGTYTSTQNNTIHRSIEINQSFVDGGFNDTYTGIHYNPSLTFTGTTNHYAAVFGSGRVGIGTLTPTKELDVVGNIQYSGLLSKGTLGYSDTDILASFQSSTNSYNQVVIQNTNSGTTASSNLNVSNDAGTATTNFGEFGINSSGFTGSGSFSQAGNVYLASASTDLVLGTYAAKPIRFVVNSGSTDAMQINSSGAIAFNGSFGTSGQVLQTNGNAAAPTWATVGGTGTVTTVSATVPNRLSVTVSTPTSTPAIAITNSGIQTITTGTATTLTSYRALVNPASLLASHTITMPASPADGDIVDIDFAGTIAVGSPAVTTFSIVPNSGQSINHSGITPVSALGGSTYTYVYYTSITTWKRKL